MEFSGVRSSARRPRKTFVSQLSTNRGRRWVIGIYLVCGMATVGLTIAGWFRFHGKQVVVMPAPSAPVAATPPLPIGLLFPRPLPTMSSSAEFLKAATNEPGLTELAGVGLGFRPVTQKPLSSDPEQPILNLPPPSTMWGRSVMGPMRFSYPSLWSWLRHHCSLLENKILGMPLPARATISMSGAVGYYAAFGRLDPTLAFTTFYAPGLDGDLIQLRATPGTNGIATDNVQGFDDLILREISGTNGVATGPRTVRRTLKKLLALNGYTLVEVRPNVIKVFPTKLATQYGSEVIDEKKYPN